MVVTILTVIVAAGAFGLLASVVLTMASRRSTLWNMAFGGVLALAVLLGALIIAWLLARRVFPA